MNGPILDIDQYRRRIGFAGAFAPDLATLAALIEHHAAAIPFENIEVIAGRVPRLDLASLHGKLVGQRRGGYCFEQNGYFLALLRQLGFAAAPLEARVRSGVPADVISARTHMAIRVELDGEEHLVDVGFAGLAPRRPLRWRDRGAQAHGRSAHRLLDVDGDVLLQCASGDGWADCYRILPSAPEAVDFEVGNWYVATHPRAFLKHNLLVARHTAAGPLVLFNRTLSRPRPDGAPADEQKLASRAELADVLADGFGLEIDAADLDAVVAALDRLSV